MQENKSILFLGATGAVGSEALNQLLKFSNVSKILLLGRKEIKNLENHPKIEQVIIDIHNPASYPELIHKYPIAICTLGVGEPSKVSKEEFIKVDKMAVLNFAKLCKAQGVKHFQLLSSVGISPNSRNYYLRTKGELVEELKNLDFERLSIFQPSMIITPKNRYGIVQALFLKVWPKLNFLFINNLRKYRGIIVKLLGKSIANNIQVPKTGIEYLHYDQFIALTDSNHIPEIG